MPRPKDVPSMALHLLDHAERLEKQAAELRSLAKLLNSLMDLPKPTKHKHPSDDPLQALRRAALPMLEMPAEGLRTAVAEQARATGHPVEVLRIVTRHMRADLAAQRNRQRNLKIVRTYAKGHSYEKTADLCGVSRRTVATVIKKARHGQIMGI